jgi:RND family efflux transporter MFP subunit
MSLIHRSLRILITLAFAALAVTLGYFLWTRYMDAPWTRDGRVRADVVQVAPDVAGIITTVAVADNQEVHKGDILFAVDDARYRVALNRAIASLSGYRREAALKREEADRRATLEAAVVSNENKQAADSAAQIAAAKVGEAQAAVEAARINLQRTRVVAPVDGYVVNLNVHPGDYAVVGRAAIAIVDRHSFRVEAYFEETRLARVHMGDRAEVRMLGSDLRLTGHVAGIARAISEPEVSGLLPDVNPTFHWVRLAQRIPVTIHLDSGDSNRLASGMTCTVVVDSTAVSARPSMARAARPR